jgi:hypothetical protein
MEVVHAQEGDSPEAKGPAAGEVNEQQKHKKQGAA